MSSTRPTRPHIVYVRLHPSSLHTKIDTLRVYIVSPSPLPPSQKRATRKQPQTTRALPPLAQASRTSTTRKRRSSPSATRSRRRTSTSRRRTSTARRSRTGPRRTYPRGRARRAEGSASHPARSSACEEGRNCIRGYAARNTPHTTIWTMDDEVNFCNCNGNTGDVYE